MKIFYLHLNVFIIFSSKVTPKGQCGDGRRLRGPSSKSRWARCSRPCLRAPRVTTCAALNLTRPAARGCSTWRLCSTKSDILGESTSISCEGIQYFHPYWLDILRVHIFSGWWSSRGCGGTGLCIARATDLSSPGSRCWRTTPGPRGTDPPWR